MFPIMEKRLLAPNVYLMKVQAPKIAKKRKAGQFVILRISEEGERFPLTIVDSDLEAGTVTIVYQAVGKSTRQLAALNVGENVLDFVGPLGNPTHMENFGRVVVIGGGVGIAPVLPIVRALKQAGNYVISIISGRNKDLIILEEEMRASCDELLIATDDGSYGFKGFPTQILKGMMDRGEKINLVVSVGPPMLMKVTCDVTRPAGIATMVSLNPIMVDGTGMCGGCRVEVGGKTKFVCVDGPEFDGHQVNYDLLMKRLRTYQDMEKESIARLDHACKLAATK